MRFIAHSADYEFGRLCRTTKLSCFKDRGRDAGSQLGASGLETDFLSEDEADVLTYPKKRVQTYRGLGASQ